MAGLHWKVSCQNRTKNFFVEQNNKFCSTNNLQIDIPDFEIWFKFDLFRQLPNSHKKFTTVIKITPLPFPTVNHSVSCRSIQFLLNRLRLPAELGKAFTNYSHHPMSALFMKNSWAWKIEAIVKRRRRSSGKKRNSLHISERRDKEAYLDEKKYGTEHARWSGVTIKAENLTSFKENLWNFIDYVQRWKFSFGMCFSPVNPHGLRGKKKRKKSSKDRKFRETVAPPTLLAMFLLTIWAYKFNLLSISIFFRW